MLRIKYEVINHCMPTTHIITCACCGKETVKSLKRINEAKKMGYIQVCSKECQAAIRVTSAIKPCAQCGKLVTRILSQSKKSKTNNVYCSHTCSALYSNAHKTTGTRRSKLEVWLEQQLTLLYPTLQIAFNKKDAITSELDIYIPSLKLAFELNGIFHYEPIYGSDKLNQIQNNDNRKFQACLEHGIDLCLIDSSKQKYFTEKSSKQYLDIITKIIDSKLSPTN